MRPTDGGTLVSAFQTVSAPAAAARPAGVAAPRPLAPGRHLAVALIPRGGPTKEHPALFVVKGEDEDDKPTILVSPEAPDARKAPALDEPPAARRRAPRRRGEAPRRPPTPRRRRPARPPSSRSRCRTSPARATRRRSRPTPPTAASSTTSPTRWSRSRTAPPVDNENSAYALASCKACTTLAVSFQLVLVVGQSDKIMPINVAEALNLNCPACITTAIAKQLVDLASRPRRPRSCCAG